MGRIFYSMAGEGRGHAARVWVITEALRRHHDFRLFAPDQAYDFLAPKYAETEVAVQRIPGLRFRYRGNRLDFLSTAAHGMDYLWNMNGLVSEMYRLLRVEQPSLVLTDFEPALPRAARRAHVPFLSLNHQHFLVACDLSSLPIYLRQHAELMALVVRAYHQGQLATIISSFFSPPLKPGFHDVIQVGALLRPEIVDAERETHDHLLVYLRRSTPPRVLELLAKTGLETRIYGLGERPREGNLFFKPIDEQTFVEDLRTAGGVICAAGNQLLGESLFLGKPVLAVPEINHFEQRINAHFLKESGAGNWAFLEELTERDIAEYLERRRDYSARIDPDKINGNYRAIEVIRSYLPEPISYPRTLTTSVN